MSKKNYVDRNLKFETLQLHVGQESPDPATDARAVPIYQTSSFVFKNSAHAAARFALQDAGNIYGKNAQAFIDNLELFSLLANVADAKSLVIHPYSTTHAELNEQEKAEQGIKPNTIRLSIGTEHIDDIIEDLEEAFKAIST